MPVRAVVAFFLLAGHILAPSRDADHLARLASAHRPQLRSAFARGASVEQGRFGGPSVQAAVVRVDAAGCDKGTSRSGSAFIWNSPQQAVTALHVIAGCSRLAVFYGAQGGRVRTARPARVLRAADLALLTIEDGPVTSPLTVAAQPPTAGEQMRAWGYPFPTRGLIDTLFTRREVTQRLKDLLNDRLRAEVQAAGMPDIEAEVLTLDVGLLLPGHSGAPLVNAAGQVVGVADGGLERGAVAVNWAIPSTRLKELMTSSETLLPGSMAPATLFAADTVAAPVLGAENGRGTSASPLREWRCGTATLLYVRTRTFAQLSDTADDPSGLRLLAMNGGQLLRPDDTFDLYVDTESGATVVVPARSTLRTAGSLCIADVYGDVLQQIVRVTATGSPAEANAASIEYEQELTKRFSEGPWQLDPSWTYTAPLTRADGLTVRRKGNVQAQQTPFGPAPAKYAFETLAAKGRTFMGVTAFHHNYTLQALQLKQACMVDPNAAGCDAMLQELRRLAQMMVATHLSSFAIS
jgi:S1-C subfamily serine protease